MASVEIRQELEVVVRAAVSVATTVTRYREPLFGYARAADERFVTLTRVAAPGHLLPAELLPGAESVVAVFVPFAAPVVYENRCGPDVAPSWARAYVETNRLLAELGAAVRARLEGHGYRVATTAATDHYDRRRLVARWSHRHVAYVAGLGSLGQNRMLITAAGCAGRLMTLVTDAHLPPSPPAPGRCSGCGDCRRRCPVGALGPGGEFDRFRCKERLDQVAAAYTGLGRADACGKCVCGTCGVLDPGPTPGG